MKTMSTFPTIISEIIPEWKENTFNLIVSSSGSGKSMMCFSNIAYGSASKLYVNNKWVNNSKQSKDKVLYIGTHMDLYNECIPPMVYFVGEVDYYKFLSDKLSYEEWNRYRDAFGILYDNKNIFLKKCEDYDCGLLRTMVESDDFKTVFLDCLEVAPSSGEKEHLEEIAYYCKHTLAKNRTIIATAQANTSLERKKLSEINSDYIHVSNSLHKEADTLLFLMKGSYDDYERLSKANSREISLGLEPEYIRKILVKDKTKNCSVPSGTCLWRYVEPGTLRWYDLFMTDSEYKIIDLMV